MEATVNRDSRIGWIIFFTTVFGLPWACWSIKSILKLGWEGVGLVLFYSGSTASIGGLIAVWWTEGWAGVRDRLLRAVKVNVAPIWWLYVVFIPLFWVFGTALFYQIVRGAPLGPVDWTILRNWLSVHVLLMLIPPLGEEFAWRGFLLPRLLRKYGTLVSVLITGFFWGIWHAPLYLDRIAQYGPQWGVYFTFIAICIGFLISAAYLRSGSLLLVVLMHFTFNLYQEWDFFPTVKWQNDRDFLMICSSVVMLVLTVGVAIPLLRSLKVQDFLGSMRKDAD